jgi:hypothetical protein
MRWRAESGRLTERCCAGHRSHLQCQGLVSALSITPAPDSFSSTSLRNCASTSYQGRGTPQAAMDECRRFERSHRHDFANVRSRPLAEIGDGLGAGSGANVRFVSEGKSDADAWPVLHQLVVLEVWACAVAVVVREHPVAEIPVETVVHFAPDRARNMPGQVGTSSANITPQVVGPLFADGERLPGRAVNCRTRMVRSESRSK